MSDLRPLEAFPAALADLKTAGKPPKLEWLALASLRIDPVYQRDITGRGRANIVRIANEFSWIKFSPVMVAPAAKNSWSIIDGQHRATAALLRGYDKVPCCIVEASGSEQAAIFAAVNGNVTRVSILELFKAGRKAGTPWAQAIDEVCAAAGLIPLTYPKPRAHMKPFETQSLGTLRQYIIRFGAGDVTAALIAKKSDALAADPGFWNSRVMYEAITVYREMQGRQKPKGHGEDVVVAEVSLAQRIRDLKARGHSSMAIAAALKVKYAEIEQALKGGA